jgi:DNA polymerase I-like protein with 3'-5' exonuclease and polymerase domains
MAIKNKCTVELAKRVLNAYRNVLPGLGELNKLLKARARNHEPIFTWGGREYYCEEPAMIDGQLRHFDYRLLNILVQGSAADCTKEATLTYIAEKPKHHRIITIPHDELLVSLPREEIHSGMRILRRSMETVKFNVPMLSEGKYSTKNWGSLMKYDEKGIIHPKAEAFR